MTYTARFILGWPGVETRSGQLLCQCRFAQPLMVLTSLV